jgi:hypothetical protein
MKMRSILVATALLCLALPGGNGLAQEKHHVSFTVPEQNAKYNISQNADVGDVPGHIVRLFDTDNVLSPGAATVNGVELTTTESQRRYPRTFPIRESW